MKNNFFFIRNTFNLVTVLAISLFCLPAFALDLKEAKSKGLLGEEPSGYLGVIKNEEGAEALANEINTKRKEEYKRIAVTSNASLESVEKLAGEKAMSLTPSGQFIKAGGSWQKK
jgi:uncharacterized protein YdbL (DUF1318 family)